MLRRQRKRSVREETQRYKERRGVKGKGMKNGNDERKVNRDTRKGEWEKVERYK